MRVVLNPVNIKIMMNHRNIYTYKELAQICGVNHTSLWNSLEKGHLSLETAYLLADGLGCKIEDIIYVDWEYN
jgi:DNA-binding XRE family transcriptional regulator